VSRPPQVIAAPVASGDKVVDDPSADFFSEVLASWPKLRAVEMEGAGAAAAVRDLTDSGKSVGFAMIRGISDLPWSKSDRPSDSASDVQTVERDQWKEYAADAAATFAVQLMAHGWPLPPRSAPRSVRRRS
jgi:nucleoside phosphorylase